MWNVHFDALWMFVSQSFRVSGGGENLCMWQRKGGAAREREGQQEKGSLYMHAVNVFAWWNGQWIEWLIVLHTLGEKIQYSEKTREKEKTKRDWDRNSFGMKDGFHVGLHNGKHMNTTATKQHKLHSNWILMFCQPHRVTSRLSNSNRKHMHILKLSHII